MKAPSAQNKIEGLSTKTLRNIFWTGGGAGVRVVMQLIVLAVLARLLTPSDFGIVAASMLVVGFADIFAMVGVGPAIIQRDSLTEKHIRTGFVMSLCFGLLITSLIYSLSFLFEKFFKINNVTEVVKALSLLFAIKSFGVVSEALLMRDLKFKKLATLDVLSYSFGYAGFSIVLAYMGAGYWALVGGALAQASMKSILTFLMVRHNVRPFINFTIFKELAHFGAGHSLARLVNFLATQGDYLIVGRLLGSASLGLYSRAFRIMQMPTSLYGSIADKVVFSAYSKTQMDKEQAYRAFERGLSLTALIGLPLSLILFFLAPNIVISLLGPEWDGVIAPFHVLAISTYPLLACKQSGSMLIAQGKIYLFACLQLFYAFLVLVGSLLGAHWGIVGVAVGVSIAVTLYYLLLTASTIKLIGMNFSEWVLTHKGGFFSMILLGVVCWIGAIVVKVLDLIPILALFLNAILLSSVAFAAIKLMPEIFLGKNGMWLKRRLRI